MTQSGRPGQQLRRRPSRSAPGTCRPTGWPTAAAPSGRPTAAARAGALAGRALPRRDRALDRRARVGPSALTASAPPAPDVPSSASARTPAGPVPAGRILVVDDNPDLREHVTRLLDPNWQVVTAIDGVDALRLATGSAFDLVLADVMMPRLDGFGLVAALRADPRTRYVPIVLLTARAGAARGGGRAGGRRRRLPDQAVLRAGADRPGPGQRGTRPAARADRPSAAGAGRRRGGGQHRPLHGRCAPGRGAARAEPRRGRRVVVSRRRGPVRRPATARPAPSRPTFCR